MINNLRYYFWASYRRKLLDNLLKNNKSIFSGIVLDIGGRDRGNFVKPKYDVSKWIFADINPNAKPDIVLDVSNMNAVENESIDTICACELFEHVENIEEGLLECFRVLKPNGHMVISVPFLYGIHGDPTDFQRWTETKWHFALKQPGFNIIKFIVMGRFFTVMADLTKQLFKSLPSPFHWIVSLSSPILDLLTQLDKCNWVETDKRLGKTHGGYFIIVQKLMPPSI